MKIALVTGGNRGIGLGIVRGLAAKGFHVLLGCRNLEDGELAVKFLEEFSGSIEPVVIDVSDKRSIERAFSKISEKFNHLEVLINNAGIIGPDKSSLIDVKIADFELVMNTNFYGAMHMSRTFLPLLQHGKDARIINVSSGMGALDDLFGGYAAYRLSKAGLNAQTILLSNDLRADRIRVFAMCPGWVRTDMGGAEADRSVEQGADTAIWLSSSNIPETGKFYRDRKVIKW